MTIKTYLETIGTPQCQVEVLEIDKKKYSFKEIANHEVLILNAVREQDKETGDFFYYGGPEDTERSFCKYMFQLDKVFSEYELVQMATYCEWLTPDGMEYVPGDIMKNGGIGGPNCRHYWIKFRGKIVLTNAPTDRQIRTLINKGNEFFY